MTCGETERETDGRREGVDIGREKDRHTSLVGWTEREREGGGRERESERGVGRGYRHDSHLFTQS